MTEQGPLYEVVAASEREGYMFVCQPEHPHALVFISRELSEPMVCAPDLLCRMLEADISLTEEAAYEPTSDLSDLRRRLDDASRFRWFLEVTRDVTRSDEPFSGKVVGELLVSAEKSMDGNPLDAQRALRVLVSDQGWKALADWVAQVEPAKHNRLALATEKAVLDFLNQPPTTIGLEGAAAQLADSWLGQRHITSAFEVPRAIAAAMATSRHRRLAATYAMRALQRITKPEQMFDVLDFLQGYDVPDDALVASGMLALVRLQQLGSNDAIWQLLDRSGNRRWAQRLVGEVLQQRDRFVGLAGNLRGANLAGIHLQERALQGVDLEGANLQGARLRGADLTNARLRGANLRGANLADAVLDGAILDGADLTEADITGGSLRGASLRGARLNFTRLIKVNLARSDFSGADLSTALLAPTNMGGLMFDSETRWPPGRTFRFNDSDD